MNRPLYDLMQRHGLKAKDVARLCGAKTETVWQWISNEARGARDAPKDKLTILKLHLMIVKKPTQGKVGLKRR